MKPLICLALLALSATADAGDISARDLTGATIQIETDSTMLVFWSLRSGYSREILDDLQRLSDAGLDVVTINTDAASESSRVRAYVRSQDLDLPVILDTDGSIREAWQVSDDPGLMLMVPGEQVAMQRWEGLDATHHAITLAERLTSSTVAAR
jgi:hypothetical protein